MKTIKFIASLPGELIKSMDFMTLVVSGAVLVFVGIVIPVEIAWDFMVANHQDQLTIGLVVAGILFAIFLVFDTIKFNRKKACKK